jgi:hypothetical protein
MEGLIGLTQSVGKREAAIRDLSVLERMDQKMEMDKQAELQAQQQEAMLFEKMYAEADKMLGKDRARINRKIKMTQRNVRKHLSDTGGSRKNFMANGGLSLVNSMGNDIVQSEEAVRYKQNKENLAHILRVKEKGLGHLLTPRDRRNLEAYERDEEGTAITYSGVMAEVEIPPSNLFDYGTAITPKDVLDYGSNAMKIRANYQMANPDDPDPSYADLVAFAKEMKYGGLGSNTTRLKEQAALAKKKMEYEAKNSTDPTKNRSLLYAIERMMQRPKEDMVVDKIIGQGEGGYIEKLKKEDDLFDQILGGRVKNISRERWLGSASDGNDGVGELFDWFNNDMYGLRDAHQLALTRKDQEAIVREMFGSYMDENGNIKNYRPDSSSDYLASGVKIKENDGWFTKRVDDFTTDYKVIGVNTALKTKVAKTTSGQEEEILLVNAYDDNGNFDEKNTKKLYQNEDGSLANSKANLAFVITLQNEEGDLIYKEVPLDKGGIQTALGNAIAKTNDQSKLVEQRNETGKMENAVAQVTAEEKAQFQTTKREMNSTVFDDPMFRSEGQEFYGANSGGQKNRHELMKSYYMAFDYLRNGQQGITQESTQQAIDNNLFTTSMELGEVTENLKDYSPENKEDAIIDMWLENMNKGETKEDVIQRNTMLAQRWKQILRIN